MKPACDASRQLVPRHLQEVFHGRQWMMEWATRLLELKGELRQLDGQAYARALDLDTVTAQLERVRQTVLQSAPFCRCGCLPNTDCPICHNTRWVSTGEFLTAHDPKRSSAASDCLNGSPN